MHWIAPSEKDAATETLEKRLWGAAGQLRANSGLEAHEHSGPILGIIFLRFAAQRAKREEASASPTRRGLSEGGSRCGSRVEEPAACHAFGRIGEVGRKNDEGSKRPQRTHQALRAANHPFVRKPDGNDGSAGAGETTAPVWNIRRRELPGSLSRTEQGRVYAECGDSLRELEESAYWLELLVDGAIVPASKLQPLRVECDELTAIFVTIIKRSKEHS